MKKTRLMMFLLGKRAIVSNSDNIIYSSKNKVNLNCWISREDKVENAGDLLSVYIVNKCCEKYGIDPNKKVVGIRHLYAIGSILLGYKDSVVWGSGFLDDFTNRKGFLTYIYIYIYIGIYIKQMFVL